MNFNFNQALADKGRRADEGMRQEWQKINDNYEIGKLNALNGGGGGGTVKPALGLAAAKTPIFSNMISPSIGSKPGVANPGTIPTNSSVFDDPLVRQGMRRGNTYVKDKTGHGNPKKDTVPAELAEGEAVLNAAAAEMLGRDEIERLNTEGAAAMGLRGGAKMKDGVMHAAAGYSGLVDMRNFDEEAAKAQIQQAANDTALGGMTISGAAGAVGKGLKGLFSRAPKAAQAAPASSTFTGGAERLVGDPALLQSAVRRGAGKVWGTVSDNPGKTVAGLSTVGAVGAGLYNGVDLPGAKAAQPAGQKVDPAQVMELAGAPSAYEQGMRAQVGVRKADNAEFSKFFNENGITDEMRANPGKAGLRRVNVPGSTDRIYQRGKNEFVGMGAPSRIAAEKARAEDPAVQKAAQMKELYTLATQGNEQAGETLRQIIKADSDIAVEGLRGKATIEAAGAKGSTKKGSGDGSTLTDQLKLGATLLGEGREAELLQAVNQRKQTAIAQKAAAGDAVGAKAIQDAELDQDFIMETANLLKQRELAAGNGKGKRAAYGGAAGAIGGGLLGLGAGIGLKQPKMISAGIGSLAGALGGGLYGYETGSSGVDEFSDLNRVAGLKNNQGALTEEGGGMVIPGDLLTPDQQVLRGLRR